MAYPVRSFTQDNVVGVLTISGPGFRFTAQVAADVVPLMADVAGELGTIPVGELLGSTAG